MNSNIVIVVLVQFMLVCTLLDGQAAALDYDNDSDQLWKIDRELFQDYLKQRDLLRVKHHRIDRPPDRVWIYANLRQEDLLQELLASEDIRHGSITITEAAGKSQKNNHDSTRQESRLMKELAAETSIP